MEFEALGAKSAVKFTGITIAGDCLKIEVNKPQSGL